MESWEDRYRARGISGLVIAKGDRTRALVAAEHQGVEQLHALDLTTGQLHPRTADPDGTFRGWLTPRGRSILRVVETATGNEQGYLEAIPWEGGASTALTSELPAHAINDVDLTEDERRLVAVTVSRETGHVVRLLELDDEARPTATREIVRLEGMTRRVTLADGGQLAVVATNDGVVGDATHLVAFDLNGQVVGQLDVESGSEVALPDGQLAAAVDREGILRPIVWDPRSGAVTELVADGIDGDVEVLAATDDGRILIRQTWRARSTLWWLDPAGAPAEPITQPPGDHVGGRMPSTQLGPYDVPLCVLESEERPGVLYRLEGDGELVVSLSAPLPGASMRSVDLSGADGDTIQAWVLTPGGPGPWPTVIHVHGGPSAATSRGWHPHLQSFVDRGFAVVAPNYHGSTTFGLGFRRSIVGRVGTLELQDLVATREWAVAAGVADPERVLLAGASYGGYLTLLGLGRHPELWAGGIAQVAIADWVAMYQHQMESLRTYQRSFFGGTPEEQPDQHRAASPLTDVDAVTGPLLIIQGRNDPRCPPEQIEPYIRRLEERGVDLEVEWYDSGHSSSDAEERIRWQRLRLALAERATA